MKTILASLLCLLAVSTYAASPSFQQFNTNDFTVVNGQSVSLKSKTVTNHIPLYAWYPNSDGTGLVEAFGLGIYARPTAVAVSAISIQAPTGYRTNITRLYYIATNAASAPATILFRQAFNGPSGTLVNSASSTSRAIGLATLGQTNICEVAFTNAISVANTNLIQNIVMVPSSVVGNSYFIGGIQIWIP